MDGFQFEYYLNELFKSNGYTSQVTKSRGDYGADLILKRDGEAGELVAPVMTAVVPIRLMRKKQWAKFLSPI
ncbi:restriction endonuclease, partial [Streptomyces albidoflavus]|uniref:restriction endonuclease n=1 Tax=Streptomyces albidoflavus TaxID=1886 RepID=UPI003325228F